jgi:hypothetical protein
MITPANGLPSSVTVPPTRPKGGRSPRPHPDMANIPNANKIATERFLTLNDMTLTLAWLEGREEERMTRSPTPSDATGPQASRIIIRLGAESMTIIEG